MKSNMLCACLIMMLLVSTMAFSSIESSGPGASSSASASASGSTTYESDSDSGWEYVYTTEDGWFSWSISCHAYASAHLTLMEGEWAAATAVGDASGSSPFGSASAYWSESYSETGDYDYQQVGDSDSVYDYAGGYNKFYAYDGVSGDSDALAVAEIEEGSGCDASASASAYASASMS